MRPSTPASAARRAMMRRSERSAMRSFPTTAPRRTRRNRGPLRTVGEIARATDPRREGGGASGRAPGRICQHERCRAECRDRPAKVSLSGRLQLNRYTTGEGKARKARSSNASPGAPESARAGDPDSGATRLPTRTPARPLRRRYGRVRCLPMPAPAASTWRGACDAGHPRVGGEHSNCKQLICREFTACKRATEQYTRFGDAI